MAAVNRVYAARLAGMVVLGPDCESIGRVRDVVISISIVHQQPRALGLVVELLTRRRIFVPIGRVTAIEPNAVTLTTANVSLRRFAQRLGGHPGGGPKSATAGPPQQHLRRRLAACAGADAIGAGPARAGCG